MSWQTCAIQCKHRACFIVIWPKQFAQSNPIEVAFACVAAYYPICYSIFFFLVSLLLCLAFVHLICAGWRRYSSFAQGDLVQLKEVPTGTSNELKSKAMDHLVMAHGLRHENINPLIGNWCFASCLLSNAIQIVTHGWVYIHHDYFDLCTRRRLAGRSNSYGDGVRVLFARFAARRINYGWHKTRLVVSIKFADRFGSRHALFALVSVARTRFVDIEKLCGRRQMGTQSHRLRTQSLLRSTKRTDAHQNCKTYALMSHWFCPGRSTRGTYCVIHFTAISHFPFPISEQLWTAPELLRNAKGHSKYGTQPADVYSFGIIMQEVVVRGEPYCMLSLSADEIISKIKKPPPLIRPSVSKGAAPPEAINIMRQCWAEQPEMRPDFNSYVVIYVTSGNLQII